MPRVPRAKSNRSQHRAASTAQAVTVSSQQTGGRTRGSRWTTTTTTRVPATISGRSRGRPPTRRVAEQPGTQLSPQEDPASLGDLEYLQSVIRSEIQWALAAEPLQPHPRPPGVPGPSSALTGESRQHSTSVTTGDVLAIPALRMGTSSSAETGLGGCLGASTVYVYM